jgi:hypothetical protein
MLALETSHRPRTFYHQMNRKREGRHGDDFLKRPKDSLRLDGILREKGNAAE